MIELTNPSLLEELSEDGVPASRGGEAQTSRQPPNRPEDGDASLIFQHGVHRQFAPSSTTALPRVRQSSWGSPATATMLKEGASLTKFRVHLPIPSFPSTGAVRTKSAASELMPY